MTVLPSPASRAAAVSSAARVDAARQQRRVADQDGVAVDGRLDARARGPPRTRSPRGTARPRSAAAGDDRGGQRVLAVGARRAATSRSRLARRAAADRHGSTSVTRGLPSVIVPVLSSTTVSELVRGLQGLGGSG